MYIYYFYYMLSFIILSVKFMLLFYANTLFLHIILSMEFKYKCNLFFDGPPALKTNFLYNKKN